MKKAKKVGRPKLPKGAAKERIVPVRFNDKELRLMTIAARATKLNLSQLVRQAVRSAFSWAVTCRACGREFTFTDIDEQHPRQAVNDMPNNIPPKPPLRNGEEQRICPHCNSGSTYERGNLRFRVN